MTSILFLCLGNICRSPMAEGIFRHLADSSAHGHRFEVDSAGNGGWHEGEPPNPRAISVARRHGIDISAGRARAVRAADLDRFDLILCMDRGNIARLEAAFPGRVGKSKAEVALYLDHATGMPGEVPDPYHGDISDYERVFWMLLHANQALLEKLTASS